MPACLHLSQSCYPNKPISCLSLLSLPEFLLRGGIKNLNLRKSRYWVSQTWVRIPIWVLAGFRPLVLSVSKADGSQLTSKCPRACYPRHGPQPTPSCPLEPTRVSCVGSSHMHGASPPLFSEQKNLSQICWHHHLLPIHQTELNLHLLHDALPVPQGKP